MIGEIIRNYLEAGNKKLTVPGLGTFMRKDSGEIIFVDLIRKDDGVLRNLIEKAGKHSDIEAMALVDRFIFEIKRGLDKDGRARIEGFGTMTFDERGMYRFKASPEKTAERIPVRDTPHRPAYAIPKAREERAAAPQARETRDAAPQTRRPAPPPYRPQKRPSAKPVRRKTAKKTDTYLLLVVIAVIAAIVAIGVMIYGFSINNKLPFIE